MGKEGKKDKEEEKGVAKPLGVVRLVKGRRTTPGLDLSGY